MPEEKKPAENTSKPVPETEITADTTETAEAPAEETVADKHAEEPAKKKSPAVTKTTLKRKPGETDAEFDARYQAAKQKEVELLAQEIERRKNSDDKSQKRKWWIKTTLILILIVASIVLMFGITSLISDEKTKPFSAMIKEISIPFLFAFLGVLILDMLLESSKYAYLLKISTGKFRLRNSIKTMFLGKYYDAITPLATGGQPFQIYYLHKKDIPGGVATAVPLVRFIVTMIVLCLMSIGVFIYTDYAGLLDGWGGGWSGSIILAISIVFMILTLCIPITIIFVSAFPRIGKKMIVGIVGLLSKMHIVKHRYPTTKKYVIETQEYRASMHLLFSKWWKLIPYLILNIVSTVVHYSIPFFAMLAIAGPECLSATSPVMDWINIMCLAIIAFFSASAIPTPGNSGASEIATSLIFCTIGDSITSMLGWIILIWRFATFYIYIVSGIGINIFEVIRSAVRRRRSLKKQSKE